VLTNTSPGFLGSQVEHHPQSSEAMRGGRHHSFGMALLRARHHHISPVWGLGGSSQAGPPTLIVDMGVVYVRFLYGDSDPLGTGIPIGCCLYGALQHRVGHVLCLYGALWCVHGSSGLGAPVNSFLFPLSHYPLGSRDS
jgi:hypothetical protein